MSTPNRVWVIGAVLLLGALGLFLTRDLGSIYSQTATAVVSETSPQTYGKDKVRCRVTYQATMGGETYAIDTLVGCDPTLREGDELTIWYDELDPYNGRDEREWGRTKTAWAVIGFLMLGGVTWAILPGSPRPLKED